MNPIYFPLSPKGIAATLCSFVNLEPFPFYVQYIIYTISSLTNAHNIY